VEEYGTENDKGQDCGHEDFEGDRHNRRIKVNNSVIKEEDKLTYLGKEIG
jgi:hypothetical protein